VVVRLTSTADNLEIEVIDNGTGLPKHNRGRLTEPYVTTRAKGTGLGLAIVQKITEQHGGTLTLEDAPSIDGTPARGALVRMRLKRLQALAVDDARTAPELATASPAHGTAA
jgi:two-component system nitrogen regulation sensor histidine kinase NtrY